MEKGKNEIFSAVLLFNTEYPEFDQTWFQKFRGETHTPVLERINTEKIAGKRAVIKHKDVSGSGN